MVSALITQGSTNFFVTWEGQCCNVRDLSRLAGKVASLARFDPIYVLSSNPLCSSLVPIWSNLNYFGRIWSNLCKWECHATERLYFSARPIVIPGPLFLAFSTVIVRLWCHLLWGCMCSAPLSKHLFLTVDLCSSRGCNKPCILWPSRCCFVLSLCLFSVQPIDRPFRGVSNEHDILWFCTCFIFGRNCIVFCVSL